MSKGQVSHLVVIDDDEDILDLVSAYFRPKGYKVDVFGDVESAFKMMSLVG